MRWRGVIAGVLWGLAALMAASAEARSWRMEAEPLDGGRNAVARADYQIAVVSVLSDPAGVPSSGLDAAFAAALNLNHLDDAAREARVARLHDMLLHRSDRLCAAYFSDIGVTRRAWSFGLAQAGATLSTVAGITTPERSSKILSTLGGVLVSSRGEIDRELFASQALPLAEQAFDRAQAARRRTAREGFAAEAPKATAAQAIESAKAYHANCTLGRAFRDLQSALPAPERPAAEGPVPGAPTPVAGPAGP